MAEHERVGASTTERSSAREGQTILPSWERFDKYGRPYPGTESLQGSVRA